MQSTSFPAIDQLLHSISHQDLALPTLPDVAHKVRHMIDDINYSAAQIVAVISGDPAIAAQVIKAANGDAFADKPKVDCVRAAVSRLGYRKLHNLVHNILAFTDHAQASHPVTQNHLSNFWEHSREVATYSYMLAKNLKLLNPEQAMLAGLVHEIGTLPLCLHAEKTTDGLDHQTQGDLILNFRSAISEQLLRTWNFPEEIIAAATGHEDFHHADDSAHASYTDIVTVANLLNRNAAKLTAWQHIPAVDKLHLSPEVCSTFHEQFHDEIRGTHQMLFHTEHTLPGGSPLPGLC